MNSKRTHRASARKFPRRKPLAAGANGIAASVCIAIATATTLATAQSYPAKPIRLIVPYPPGGGVDATGRVIAQALTEQLGHSVIVENRGGATGRIGTELVARASPDGYTLLLGSGAPNAVIPSVTPNLPYDAVKDFAPVSLVGTTDYTLVVHPSLPVRTVKDLIAVSKANPRKLTYGSSGILSNTHLCGELLNLMAGINAVHVAYKGTGPALLSVLTGETVMSYGGGGAVMPHVTAKRLRALATTGTKRRATDVPTIAETLPGYHVNQWYAVMAPAGTAPAVIDRLHREIVLAVGNPKVAQQFTNLDTDAVSSSPQELATLIRTEIEKWAKVVKAANLRLD